MIVLLQIMGMPVEILVPVMGLLCFVAIAYMYFFARQIPIKGVYIWKNRTGKKFKVDEEIGGDIVRVRKGKKVLGAFKKMAQPITFHVGGGRMETWYLFREGDGGSVDWLEEKEETLMDKVERLQFKLINENTSAVSALVNMVTRGAMTLFSEKMMWVLVGAFGASTILLTIMWLTGTFAK